MPFSIEQHGDRHCVMNTETGENMGCHDTPEAAQAAMDEMMREEGMMPGKAAPQPELKCIAIKAADAELTDNRFKGYPSVMGNVDEGGDVILPGAFKTALADFVTAGFIPIGHDWIDLPVAYPITASEVGNKLYAESEYHTTQKAQDARTVVKERLAAGKDVGLSIAFDIAPGGQKMLDDGESFLKFADEGGYDLKLMDPSLVEHKAPIRAITKIRRLFEFSIVSVPMNPRAIATGAKSRILASDDFTQLTKIADFEDFLRDAGFSVRAAKQFISQLALLKGIDLPRDVDGSDAPDPDGQEPPAVTAGQKPPTEPVVIEPRPLLYVPSTGRFIPNVTSH